MVVYFQMHTARAEHKGIGVTSFVMVIYKMKVNVSELTFESFGFGSFTKMVMAIFSLFIQPSLA